VALNFALAVSFWFLILILFLIIIPSAAGEIKKKITIKKPED